MEFLACINRVILGEAAEIGGAMGLSPSLVTQVVNWSCGPSWVAEHMDSYEPCFDSIAVVDQKRHELKLSVINRIFQQSILDVAISPRMAGLAQAEGVLVP
ncbi:hypothetical protein [Pseudomonas brenneri]|uniref:hypothetical protein n=1 Tax=Pseudomonas brenneri TaxID=129817 RepID=UPI0028D0C711|nr:hypothetical protein [Pseudomonas brenneri]